MRSRGWTPRASCAAARRCARCWTGAGRRRTTVASAGPSGSTAPRRWPPRRGWGSRSTGSRSCTPASWTRRIRSRAGGRSGASSTRLARGSMRSRSSGCTWRASAWTCGGRSASGVGGCDGGGGGGGGGAEPWGGASGERRGWLGGRGRNIPSFELFTSPDWRGTEGWVRFDQALYRSGNLVEGIRLAFAGGLVTEVSAEENEPVLREMIATEGADRVGEFSLTDRRFSRITRFMAQTLYDENVACTFDEPHIALGRSYQDA